MSVDKQVRDDFECFIRNAASIVESFSPTGLGQLYAADRDACLDALEKCRDRFRRMLIRARREHGWRPN